MAYYRVNYKKLKKLPNGRFVPRIPVEIEEITQNQKCPLCLRPGCSEHSEKDLIHQEEEKCLHMFLQGRATMHNGIATSSGIFCIDCDEKISE